MTLVFRKGMDGFAARLEQAIRPDAGVRVVVDHRVGPRRRTLREISGPEKRHETRRHKRPIIDIGLVL